MGARRRLRQERPIPPHAAIASLKSKHATSTLNKHPPCQTEMMLGGYTLDLVLIRIVSRSFSCMANAGLAACLPSSRTRYHVEWLCTVRR